MTSPSSSIPSLGAPDHISLSVQDAHVLHTFFTKSLGLPCAWPRQVLPNAKFSWVSAGNLTLEIWENAQPNAQAPSNFIQGLALDSQNTTQSVVELKANHFRATDAKTFATKNEKGQAVPACYKSNLLDISAKHAPVFICEWNPGGLIFPWKEQLSSAARRFKEQNQLAAIEGGPLGIQGVCEIGLGAVELDKAVSNWEKVYGSAQIGMSPTEANYCFSLGNQIDLVLRKSTVSQFQFITFKVQSLDKVRESLKLNSLLGAEGIGAGHKEYICLHTDSSAQLEFRFRE